MSGTTAIPKQERLETRSSSWSIRTADTCIRRKPILSNQWSYKAGCVEGSASCMFVYTIAKGVKKNYLPVKYLEAAQRGYDGIIENMVD